MKKMDVTMTLLSDTIFGNGRSIPGEEDISVLCDEKGFPYYRGSTFKGVFREELERYVRWEGKDGAEYRDPQGENIIVRRLCGSNRGVGDNTGSMTFSDFVLPEKVRRIVLKELGENSGDDILNACTNVRAFTRIDEGGTAAFGSLRTARCVNRGLVFVGKISMEEEDEQMVREVLSMIRWIGTMRNRGFGKVSIVMDGGKDDKSEIQN